MAARKRRGTRTTGNSAATAADEPCSRPEPVAAGAPSGLQKCLLAAAMVLEASWVAALLAMALAE